MIWDPDVFPRTSEVVCQLQTFQWLSTVLWIDLQGLTSANLPNVMSFPLPLSHSASAPLAFFEFFESSSVLPLGLQHALFLCLEYPSFILSEVQRSFLLPLYQSILLRAWPLSCSPARFFHSMFPLLYFLTHLLICFCIMWLMPSPFILCFVSGEIIFFFFCLSLYP